MIEEKETKKIQKSRYHHGDLRAGLIEATRRLVEEKGPDGFSVTDACKLAGVSTAAPYKHFRNKEEMLAAVALDGMTRLGLRMMAALQDIPVGTAERIKVMGIQYVRFALREPGVFRLKFGGFTDNIDDCEMKEAGERTFGLVLSEVAKCLGETEITQEVRRRGFMLWNFVHGLSFILNDEQLTEMGGDIEVEDLLADMAERLLQD